MNRVRACNDARELRHPMTTDRHVAERSTRRSLREEIKRMAGTQFDPEICQLILIAFGKLSACIRRHAPGAVTPNEGVLKAS